MDEHRPDSRPLLTLDQVQEWLAKRASEARELAAVTARLEVLDRKLEAVRLLLGDDLRQELFGTERALPPVVNGKPSETPFRSPATLRREWIVNLVFDSRRGLTSEEIVELAHARPPPDGEEVTIVSARALTDNMARRGHLRRRGHLIYHPDVIQKIDAGTIEDITTGGGYGKADFKAIVRNAVKKLGSASSKAVIAELRETPEAQPFLERNPQYPYSLLSRMAANGELMREGGIYRIADDPQADQAQLPKLSVSEDRAGGGDMSH